MEIGSVRIKVKDLCAYEKTKTSWKKSKFDITNALYVIDLFYKHDNLDVLIDNKDSRFFKGFFNGKARGARINVLPDNTKLTGAFSLFAKNLTIHDQKSNEHWDVIYENPSGFCYLYDVSKRKHAVQNKYKKVREFEKIYPVLEKNVLKSLSDKKDKLVVPMYTLLKTKMRVGNEIYYSAHGHKGLTTLQKKDISIKGNKVIFNYVAKDGVPLVIEEEFPDLYVRRLKEMLKCDSFVFTKNGHPLKDTDFKVAFKKYCGEEFYPHIVRSFFATNATENFLKSHKKASKKEVKEFLLSVADKLGHRRFDKKDKIWKDSSAVTLHHYIDPKLVNRLKKF